MARNLEEPGANFNQLLELSLKLQNARTFAGTVADATTEVEQYADGGRIGLKNGGSLEKLLRNYWQGMGPWGKGSTGAFYFSDLYDALAPYLGAMFSEGGRVGFDQGGMSRRTFLKLLGGLGSMPLLGKYVKWAKPLAQKLDDIKITMRGDVDYEYVDEAWSGGSWSNVMFEPLTKKGTQILKKIAKQKNSFLKEVKSKYGNYFEPDSVEDAVGIAEKIKPNAKMNLNVRVGKNVKGATEEGGEYFKTYSKKDLNKKKILDEVDDYFADDMGGYGKKQFDEYTDMLMDVITKKAKGGRIYGKYAQQLASGGRVGLADGTSNPSISNKLLDWLLTPENVDKAGAWAKKNVKLIEKLTQNKLLPSAARLYLRSISGSKTKITEDFFSKSELKEIKKRVTEAEVSKALSGHATQGGGSLFRVVEGHSGIGYTTNKAKTIPNAFKYPDVNIDMTLGQAGFYRNKDGSYQVYDKHNFSNMMGSLYWYGNEKEIAQQIESLSHLYTDSDVVAGKILERFDTVEPNKEVLAKVIESYKNGDITLTKLMRTIGGYLASDDTKEVVKKDYEGQEYIDREETQKKGVPISLNIGTISQKDKYEVDTKVGFGEYDENWDSKKKGEYENAPTLGQAYAQMIFEDAPFYPKKALGHPSGKSPGKLVDENIMGKYEKVGIPSAIRMEAQKYIKKHKINELDPNWQEARREDKYIWDKDKKHWVDLYNHPDIAPGVPYIYPSSETLSAQDYQERGKPHHPEYDLVPYSVSESTGEDLYPGFLRREYKEFNKGGRAGYQGGDIVPKPKPFTADMFKDKADLYLQGIFAGPNKDLFLPKIRSVLQRAVNEGSITQEEGMKFISDRILFYKNFAEENPKGTLPRWEKNKGGRAGFFRGALADTKSGKAMSPGTSASGGRRGDPRPGGGDPGMTYIKRNKVPKVNEPPYIPEPITPKIEKAVKKKIDPIIAKGKKKQEDYFFNKKLWDSLEKYKTLPGKGGMWRGVLQQNEKTPFTSRNILDSLATLSLKYPNIKITDKYGYINKENAKQVIDQAYFDGSISLGDSINITRTLDTMGEGVTGINLDTKYLDISGLPEANKYTVSSNVDIGDLNLGYTGNLLNNDITKQGLAFNYDDKTLTGGITKDYENDYTLSKLGLDKTFDINDILAANVKGNISQRSDQDFTTSSLTPGLNVQLPVGSGILKSNIAKNIIEGGETNLGASLSYPLSKKGFTFDDQGMVVKDERGIPLESNINLGNISLSAQNLLSENPNALLGYSYEKGSPYSNDPYFEVKANWDPIEGDKNFMFGLKKKFNKGGRIGLAEGDTPSQAWMRNNFYDAGYDDKGIITLYEYMNGPIGWSDYMSYGPGKS